MVGMAGLKNPIGDPLTKQTRLPFSMSDFPQFIIYKQCCVKQMKQELIS